ncbi:MAG: xanthine dehydrogenase family protein subunit M [Pseudohongiellaceae bacterium]
MRYETPVSIADAVALLQGSPARGQILAGGTDLIVQMRSGAANPQLLLDIKHIPETRRIEFSDGRFEIGAAVSGAELNENEAFKTTWPGVAEAFDLIGSTQIQGRATLGGNLCNASPAADTVPALIAADAVCRIAGPDGERQVPAESIITQPGRTSLAAGEFIVSIRFPRQMNRTGDAYLRLIPRTEMDIAVAGAGVCLTLDSEGRCATARVALGAVGPTPLLVNDAGAALIGSRLEAAALDSMAEAVAAACRPINDKRGTIDYRTRVAAVLARRSALMALNRAENRT